MKIIFLDIDGVLNHQLFYEKESQSEGREKYGYPYSDLDTEKLDLLNGLIDDTGAEVVCSSTWRIGVSPSRIEEILNSRGFKHPIKDNTPVLSFDGNFGSVPRGCEINQWIEYNIPYEERCKLKFVIFDDDSDMLLSQYENYFMIDRYCGITPSVVYRAKRFLNGE